MHVDQEKTAPAGVSALSLSGAAGSGSASVIPSAAAASTSASKEDDPLAPDSTLVVRRLAIDDYDKGYITLLSQLTNVGTVTRQQFESRFRQVTSSGYYFGVVWAVPRPLTLEVLFRRWRQRAVT